MSEREKWEDQVDQLEAEGFLTAVEARMAKEKIAVAYSARGPRLPFPLRVHVPDCRFPDETCVCP